MIEVVISENDKGQRLDRFLDKAYPALNQGLVRKLLRKKRIKVNRARSEANYILKANDVLQLYLSEELLSPNERKLSFLDVKPDINVLYEDDNILLINKPVGIIVHAENVDEGDTLINRVKRYLYDKGEFKLDEKSFTPALCNRLDRNTTGIVIAAKTAEALRILNEKIKRREITKKYLCLLAGKPPKDKDLITAYLKKDSEQNIVIVSDTKTDDNLTIKTGYRVLDDVAIAFPHEDVTLAEIELITGRTHQIRAHMAYIGCPVLGDGKYGDISLNRKYRLKHQALCAYHLTFDFPTDAGALDYLKGKTFETKDIWFLKQ